MRKVQKKNSAFRYLSREFIETIDINLLMRTNYIS